MNIFLIGSMGVGKAAIGRGLKDLLGIKFIDTDDLIVTQEGQTINAIFSEKGENYFRKVETDILTGIDHTKKLIIATGGGLPITGENMAYMKENGVVVYLHDELDSIVFKLFKGKYKRPAIKDLNKEEIANKVSKMLEKRIPIYQQAHLTFTRSKYLNKDVNQLSIYLNMFI